MLLLVTEVRDHPVRFAKTLCLCAGSFAQGMLMGATGSALHDLMQQIADDSSTATSVIVSISSAGYLTGTFLCESLSLSLCLASCLS